VIKILLERSSDKAAVIGQEIVVEAMRQADSQNFDVMLFLIKSYYRCMNIGGDFFECYENLLISF